jgi:RHS repeat-associated protein
MNYATALAIFRFLAVIILILGSSCAIPLQAQTDEGLVADSTELRVLRQFYWATGGTNWLHSDHWLQGTSLAEADDWNGVTVENGDVVGLNLSQMHLTGPLPIALGKLTQLRSLFLAGNNLLGPLPVDWGELHQLTELVLWGNRFSGSLPTEWEGLMAVTRLEIPGSRLSGPLPASWSGMQKLQRLLLSGNRLSDSIPESWGQLYQLQQLDLRDNRLRGRLPDSMEQLYMLGELALAGNRLTGALPEWITKLPLSRLDVQGNLLTSLPSWATTDSRPSAVLAYNNQLDFGNLETNFSGPGQPLFSTFSYHNQKPQPGTDTASCMQGGNLTLTRTMAGAHNHYQWERLIGQSWIELPQATGPTLELRHIEESMSGLYRTRVINDWVPNAILYTRPVYVDMMPYSPPAENLPVESSKLLPATSALAPPAFTGNPDSLLLNYVRTYTSRQEFTDATRLTQATVAGVQIKTEYLDGLGRPVQTVLRQESPLLRDVVQPMAYDEFGLQPKTYLPYTAPNATGTPGSYRSNSLREQYEFYHDAPIGPGAPTDGLARTGVPYSETAFELSPPNRPVAQASPGEAWQMATNRVVLYQQRANTLADEVRTFTIDYATRDNVLVAPSYYPAGELWVKETRDEHGTRTLEFQNKQGQVLLKKAETSVPQQVIKGNTPTQWLETYYIYDDFEHLRVVLPPKAVAKLRKQQWEVTSALENLLFRYRYDARGRLIAKRTPGTDSETQMIYDQLDRVILSQDAAQRQRQEWSFTKYDVLGRPIATGLCTRNATQQILQAEADNVSGQYEKRSTNGPYFYTADLSYPRLSSGPFTQARPLTLTYYDDYNFDNDASGQSDANYDPQYDGQFSPAPRPDTRVTGQVTRTRIRVLGIPDNAVGAWLTTTTFYDEQARPIQVSSTNARGGQDIVTTQLDFAGKALKTYTVHTDPRTAQPLTIAETHAYDHTGRLLSTSQQLAGEAQPTVIATLRYNELGQLQQKHLGLGEQNVDYQYNIRGWLTHLNDAEQRDPNDLWGMELYYEHGFTRDYLQFNGNITGQKWRSQSDGITRAYGYVYDASNRLLQGDFVARAAAGTWSAEKQNYGLRFVSYDENGNILTLRRRGLRAAATRTSPKQYGPIDQLNYTYDGNRLLAVDDAVQDNGPATPSATSLAGDFQDNGYYYQPGRDPEYRYDANGSLTVDRNKGITNIRYNHLNLPQRIAMGVDSLVFRYSATGQKVAKLVYQTGKPVQQTDYAGPFQYEQDTLRFFPHAEGRVLRFAHLDGSNQPQVRYVREFSLKDHLGNLRMAYRPGDSAVYHATMEMNPASTARREEQQFDSVRVASTRFAAGPLARTGSYVARLNAALGKSLGPVKVLSVHKGDTITVTAPGLYQQEVPNRFLRFALPGFVAGMVLQRPTNTPPGGELKTKHNSLPFLGLSLSLVPALHPNGSVPKGYMRILVYNADSTLVDTRTQELTIAAHNSYQVLYQRIVAPVDGYIQAYVGNDSNVDVYFDDIEVRYNPGLVIQQNNYDPWGLNLVGLDIISGIGENKFTWNGKEKQLELGLNWLDHGWRFFDSQLGRWHTVDPDAEEGEQESWSPYQFGFNNALRYNDLNGRISDDRLGPNATVGPEHSSDEIRRHNSTTTLRSTTNISITYTRTSRYAETESTTSTIIGSPQNIQNISSHSAEVVSASMRQAKVSSIRVNRTQSTVREEARAMYVNASAPNGIQKSYNLYASSGDKVVKVFENGQKSGLNREQIISNMATSITSLGPTNVSKHLANPANLNVIDFSSSALGDKAAAFNTALKSNIGVSRFFSPYTAPHRDPAFHIEIPQR